MNPSPAVPVARALAGASLVVTRPAADATAFVRRARSLGAHALRLPGTALRARGALAMPDPPCEAWIFTSPAAVRHAFTSARLVPDARVAAFAVGEGTRRALARHGIAADRHYQLQQYGVKKRAHEDFDPVQAALVLEQVEADQQAQPLRRPSVVEPSHG